MFLLLWSYCFPFQDVLLPVHHRGVQIVPSWTEPNPSILLRPSHSTWTRHKWVICDCECECVIVILIFLLFWLFIWWLVGLFFSWLPVVFFFVCFLFACVLLVCLFVNWGVAFLLSFFQASNRRARLLTWVFGWIPGVTGIPESPSTWKIKSWRGKDFHNFFSRASTAKLPFRLHS